MTCRRFERVDGHRTQVPGSVLWERGGVSVVTFCYHFKGWAYDRWDADFEIRIIDPKAP